MPFGIVARFDTKRGFGFVTPSEGGDDLFIHQNDIKMVGFRFLNVGEKVSYDVEEGARGKKAVEVTPVEAPEVREAKKASKKLNSRPPRERERERDRDRRPSRNDKATLVSSTAETAKLAQELEKLKRKQERLISLLVKAGIIENDSLDVPVSLDMPLNPEVGEQQVEEEQVEEDKVVEKEAIEEDSKGAE